MLEAEIIETPADGVLDAEDGSADDEQADDAMEEGAMAGEVLEFFADDAEVFAEGAAGVVDVGSEGAEGGEAVEDAFEQQLICRDVRVGGKPYAEYRWAGEVEDAVEDDGTCQPEYHV